MKRKKLLLGLLLVPALMLTGCPLNDDTSPKVEQNEETQKTEQEILDERYTMLHNLVKSTFNVEDAVVTIEEHIDFEREYTINEKAELTSEEKKEYEKILEEYSHSMSIDAVIGYNLINGTYYEENYEVDSNGEYYMSYSTYIAKKNNKYIRYSMNVSDVDTKSENKQALYVGEDHTKKVMISELTTSSVIDFITTSTTIDELKKNSVLSANKDGVPFKVEDVIFDIVENDGVYTATYKVNDLEFVDNSLDTIYNLELKISYDNEKVISSSVNNKYDSSEFLLQVGGDKEVLADMNFESSVVSQFGKSFDDRKLYQNFTDYGTVRDTVANIVLHLNGVEVATLSNLNGIPYGTSVLDDSIEEKLTTGYGELNEIITGEFYIDEECTKRYYREFDVWPSYEVNIYTKADETKIGETKTLALIEHVYTDYSYSEGKILTLAEYTGNSIDLKTLKGQYYTDYEMEEILLDGEVVSENVDLTDRRIIKVTIKYKPPVETA